jgi:hypothetical protein
MTVSAFAVNGQPECPQTSPGTQWKTVAPPTPTPTSDTEPAVPFTTTNIVGDVQLCTSIAKTEFGGLSATECFGPTLTAHKLPYATDICSLHIHEYVRTGKDGAEFAVKIDAYDGNGGLLHTLDRHDQWSSYGTSLTISKGPLLNDITIDFLNGKAAPRSNKRNEISRKKRGEILPPGLDYDVQISADAATVWSTEDRDTKTLPHCEVGDWDTHDIVGEDLWGTNYFVQPVSICFLSYRSKTMIRYRRANMMFVGPSSGLPVAMLVRR